MVFAADADTVKPSHTFLDALAEPTEGGIKYFFYLSAFLPEGRKDSKQFDISVDGLIDCLCEKHLLILLLSGAICFPEG